MRRNLARHESRESKAAAAMPGFRKALPMHFQSLRSAGAQDCHVTPRVVADEHGVMPDRQALRAEILEHQHRAAGGKLRHHFVGRGREHIRQPSVPARRADQLELEAAAPARKEDFRRDALGRDVDAAGAQQRCERRRPALVVVLWKERRRAEFDRGRCGGRKAIGERRRGRATGKRDRERRDRRCASLHVFLKMSMTPVSSRMISTTNTMPITASASPPAGACPI